MGLDREAAGGHGGFGLARPHQHEGDHVDEHMHYAPPGPDRRSDSTAARAAAGANHRAALDAIRTMAGLGLGFDAGRGTCAVGPSLASAVSTLEAMFPPVGCAGRFVVARKKRVDAPPDPHDFTVAAVEGGGSQDLAGAYVKQPDKHDGRPWYQHAARPKCRAFYVSGTSRWYFGEDGNFGTAIYQTCSETDDMDVPLQGARWEARSGRSGTLVFG